LLFSAQEGRTAATRLGNGGVDRSNLKLRAELCGDAAEIRDMKRMTESRSRNLREHRTLRAGCIPRDGTGFTSKLSVAVDDMAQFVNHGTLLCRYQHSQEA